MSSRDTWISLESIRSLLAPAAWRVKPGFADICNPESLNLYLVLCGAAYLAKKCCVHQGKSQKTKDEPEILACIESREHHVDSYDKAKLLLKLKLELANEKSGTTLDARLVQLPHQPGPSKVSLYLGERTREHRREETICPARNKVDIVLRHLFHIQESTSFSKAANFSSSFSAALTNSGSLFKPVIIPLGKL